MNKDRLNNFDLLRLFAALQVVHSHAVEHLHIGYGTVGRGITELLSLFPGVPIFFVISGFLISRAFERSTGVTSYARNRMLRIYPALWVSFAASLVLLTAFGVLTPSFVARPAFWAWAAGQLTVVQFFNPDTLRGFGVGVLNGSLWTIPVELQFYVAVPLIYRWCVAGRAPEVSNRLVGGAAAVSIAAWLWWSHGLVAGTMTAKLLQITIAPHLFMFLIGMLVQRNWTKLAPSLDQQAGWWLFSYVAYRLALPGLLPATASGVSTAVAMASDIVAVGLLAALVMSAAHTARSASHRILCGHDLSYGVYLYHMLVVNAFVQLGMVRTPVALLSVFALTLAAAAASWLVVEQPMLRAKRAVAAHHPRPQALPALSS